MTTHMDDLRDQLATAEGRLRNVRDNLENSAKRYGESLTGIFSDTFFVPRSVAERWLDNAEHKFLEREAKNFQHVNEALRIIAAAKKSPGEDDDNPGDPGDPGDEGDEGDDAPYTPPDKRKKGKKKAAPTDDDVEEAATARFFASAASGNEYQDWVKTGAAAIVRAAAKRRGEAPKRPDWEHQGNHPKPDLRVMPAAPPPPKGSMARQIIDAGRKARNLPPIDED